jgi:CRP/FNR family transcriptional regulator, cyclic AMP receptor protein
MAKVDALSRDRKLELIAAIPLFSACSRRELAQVASLTVPAHMAAGAILTREGASGGIAFILVSGSADVLRGGKRLATLGPGDVVGELSLIDGEPRSATVKATSDLEVLQLDGRDLNKLFKKVPSVVRKLLEALAGRVRDVDDLHAVLG